MRGVLKRWETKEKYAVFEKFKSLKFSMSGRNVLGKHLEIKNKKVCPNKVHSVQGGNRFAFNHALITV